MAVEVSVVIRFGKDALDEEELQVLLDDTCDDAIIIAYDEEEV